MHLNMEQTDITQSVNSTHSQPLVSIGIPVYNGERFLQEALDSV